MLLRHYGLPVIVALNHFGSDTERELEMIGRHLRPQAGEGDAGGPSG
jgi:formyltetrahydrofolate synthetase